MNKFVSPLCAVGLLSAAMLANAGFRIQHYSPELRWMSQPIAEEAKLEAAILAPKGLSCYLPSAEGFCTIPLFWLTNQDAPASLWRSLDGSLLKVASGFDGQVNATVRLNKSPSYQVIQGDSSAGKVLDSATLTAIWDPVAAANLGIQKQGTLEAQNNGDCQIFTGHDYCEVQISWSSKNVESASLWMRTPAGLVSVFEGAKEASLKVAAYEHASIYELREGRAATGELLSAAMTKGHRVVPAGEISLPDGASCGLAPGQKTCDLRVSWKTNDLGRLWVREKPMSSVLGEGQALVSVSANGAIVDLRAGASGTGDIIDRANLSTMPVEGVGSLTALGSGSCEIPYSGSTCDQTIRFEITPGVGSVWSEDGQSLASGPSGEVIVAATEYGKAYHLRAGTEASSPILDTYIAKGIRQTYRGSISAVAGDSCVFDHQGGSCQIAVEYEATDFSSIWETASAQRVAGGSKSGQVNLTLTDLTGEAETLRAFDLRIHGNFTPKISDPVLGSIELKGIQPSHTGQLSAPSGVTCNILYSQSQCNVALRVVTTSPVVTLWNNQTNTVVWEGGQGTTNFTLPVSQGAAVFTLREGRKAGNKSFGTLTLTGNRPSYFTQLTMPAGTNCTTTDSNGSCALTFKLNSNTVSRIFYRDITTNPNASWVSWTNGLSNGASVTFTAQNITANRVYEFRAEQNSSPYEPLDIITATVTLNAQHAFELTSILPQPGNGIQCGGEWSVNPGESKCHSTTPITWTTTAANITACRRLANVSSYEVCQVSSNKQTSFGGWLSLVDREYKIDFYEGSVSTTSEADADAKKLRRLSSVTYVPGRMLAASEHTVGLDKSSYSCELTDISAGSCGVSLTVSHTLPTKPIHQTSVGTGFTLYYYFAKKGSATVEAGPFNAAYSINAGLTINAGAPQEFEIRIREGSAPKVNDPVIRTFTGSTTYRNVTGWFFGQRGQTNTGYSNNMLTNSAEWPHVFVRPLSGSVYSSTAEDCLLLQQKDACTIYLMGQVSSGSRASLFINDVYVDSFTTSLRWDVSSKFLLNLPLGTHSLKMYEGTGSSASTNKLLDEFSITVRRPPYTGALKARTNDIALSYYGETQTVSFDINTNTLAHVYDVATNAKVGSYSPAYTADEKFRVFYSFGRVLGAGEHVLELRTHENANDPNNIVLARETVRLTHKEQTIELAPHASYPQFFSECPLSEAYKTCIIYLNYKTAHVSSNGIVACEVSTTGVRKLSSLSGVTAYTGTSFAIINGATEIRFYNGQNCPSSVANNEGYPLLMTHPVKTVAQDSSVSINVQKNTSSAAVVPSETEPKTWICHQLYQGASCGHVITITPNAAPISGQNPNAYYGLYYSQSSGPGVYAKPNSFIYPPSGTTYAAYTVSASTPGSGDAYYDVYSCTQASNGHPSYCPTNTAQLRESFKVINYLPEYSATISAPDGVGCMANYGQTTCSIKVNFSTTSGHALLVRDGVSIDSFNVGLSYSKTFSFTAKAKGIPTVLKVVDGTNVNNRVLATLEVFPEVFDENVFNFADPNTNGVLNKVCINGYLTGERINCDLNIAYKSDAAKKYITATGQIDKAEVSGDGVIAATGSYGSAFTGFANSGSGGQYIYLYAYVDQAKTKLADALLVNYKNMSYSDNILTGVSGTSVTESNPSYGSYWGGKNVGYVYYITNYGDSIYVQSPIVIDDIQLSAPANCSTTSSKNGSPDFCSLIDYKTVHQAANPGTLSRPTVTVANGSGYTVKRLYYRASNRISLNINDWSDASVTIGGQVRPLNMDGAWHYIDVSLAGGAQIQFSAINESAGAKNFGVDVFAEYY